MSRQVGNNLKFKRLSVLNSLVSSLTAGKLGHAQGLNRDLCFS